MTPLQLQLLEPQTTLIVPQKSTQKSVRLEDINGSGVANGTSLIQNPYSSLDTALQHIFPTKQEDTRLQKARRIMGEEIATLSDEDLEVYLTKFQNLIDCWLDDFERHTFDNQTLKQVLREV